MVHAVEERMLQKRIPARYYFNNLVECCFLRRSLAIFSNEVETKLMKST